MSIKISQLPELGALSSNVANSFLVLVDNDAPSDYLKTKKITVDNFLKVTKEYGDTPGLYYVSKGGNNTNDGKSWDKAFLTIEKALEVANTRNGEITVVDVGPGIYETQGHLDLPDNTIVKTTHRAAVIRPAVGYEERNVFRMGSGCFIEGFLIEDFRLNDMENPTEGFAVSFRPGANIRRVPYAHKIAVRTTPYWTVIAPPLDRNNANPLVGLGGGVALADGDVCDPQSVFPNIMTWGATPVTHNGIGYCAKNGGLINAVNAVSLWCHRHFYALGGGQIILSSCSTQFGDYTMVSTGFRQLVQPVETTITITPSPADANVIRGSADAIVNGMLTTLNTTINPGTGQIYTSGWTTADQAYTRSTANTLLQSLTWVIETGNEKPMIDFAKSLFTVEANTYNTTNAVSVFSNDKKDAFIFSFDNIRDQIIAGSLSPSTDIAVNDLIDNLNTTINTPTKTIQPSVITAIGHTWSSVMAGVALTKIPPATNEAKIQDSILELNQGLVIASGQDDQGSALFVGGMSIDADTGELSGPPFTSAVNRIATKTVISRSF
jgi:hypothetical protein